MKKAVSSPAVAMDYNIAQLLKQPIGAAREYDLHEDLHGLDPALDLTEPLGGKIKLLRSTSGVLLALNGETSLRVHCSRCLEPVVVPVSLSFEEEFLQTLDVISGVPLDASKEDPALLIDSHHELHLADVVREYLLIALPMHPLCREECKGLCQNCGYNLNDGPCACDANAGDEQWSALKSLLKE